MTNEKRFEDDDIIEETADTSPEEIDSQVVEETMTQSLQTVKEKLKVCKKEKAAQLEELQRTKADFLNSKRRLEERAAEDVERARNAFIEDLLPLCDSFEQAMGDEKMWEHADQAWKSGVEAIQAQLRAVLNSYSVSRFGAVGDTFDPNTYEAVSVDENTDAKPDTVTEVLQSGYMRKTYVIRPAKVVLRK